MKITLPLAELEKCLNPKIIRGKLTGQATGINFDSRQINRGDIFVAISGLNKDGHRFISDAFSRGAILAVGERAPNDIQTLSNKQRYVQVENSRLALSSLSNIIYRQPTKKLFTVGITGTNGKTTTAHLARQILGRDCSLLISTVELPQNPGHKKPVTTPEAPIIHRLAHKAVTGGKRNLIMEVSSHGLALNRTNDVDFDCRVFTNLTRDHLDFYQSFEDYKQTKLSFFTQASEHNRVVVNVDDPYSEEIIAKTPASILTFGLNEKAQVQGDNVSSTGEGINFTVSTPGGGRHRISAPLIGDFNAENILGAFSIGLVANIPPKKIIRRLSTISPIPGRMERISKEIRGNVFVDFAHNPRGLEKSLTALKPHFSKLHVIFGCGGESDRGKRPLMGQIACSIADHTIITNDNPKSEDPKKIIKEIVEGVPRRCNYEIIENRKEAIRHGLETLQTGEVLLIAGKGHEKYQIIGKRWVEYNDKDFVLNHLNLS